MRQQDRNYQIVFSYSVLSECRVKCIFDMFNIKCIFFFNYSYYIKTALFVNIIPLMYESAAYIN